MNTIRRLGSTWSTLAPPVLALVLLTLLAWPVWRWLWGEWWGNDYYTHGILILPISVYFAWRRWLTPASADGDSRGLIVLLVGLALLLLFIRQKAFYLAAFTIIINLAGLVWTFGGLNLLRRLAFPLTFLALMIPLPFIERITLPLALWTGVCSGTLVRWLGLDVVITGVAVTLSNTTLVIGAQCSGINSIIALFTLTTVGAYIINGPLWGRLALVIMAIPLALLGNILRVANLLFVARHFGPDAAFTFYHDYSGYVFFMIVLILLIPLTRLLQCKTLRFEVL